MARELVTMVWCDVCASADEVNTKATASHVIALDDVRRAIDLCARHAEAFITSLEYALSLGTPINEGRSRRPGRSPTDRGGEDRTGGNRETGGVCPVCQWRSPGGSDNAVRSHLKSAHQTTLAQVTGTATMPCPVDGCTFKAKAPQGLVAHVRIVHPTEYLDTAPEGSQEALDVAS